MSNTTVEFEQINYSINEKIIEELYDKRDVMVCGWEDFMNLPINDAYASNKQVVKREYCKKKEDDSVKEDVIEAPVQ